MKIKPLNEIVYLDIQKVNAGVLDTSSRESAVEFAKVLAVPSKDYKELYGIEVGDTVFVKAWAVDTVTYQNNKYYFVNINSGGLLAVVK